MIHIRKKRMREKRYSIAPLPSLMSRGVVMSCDRSSVNRVSLPRRVEMGRARNVGRGNGWRARVRGVIHTSHLYIWWRFVRKERRRRRFYIRAFYLVDGFKDCEFRLHNPLVWPDPWVGLVRLRSVHGSHAGQGRLTISRPSINALDLETQKV